LTGATITIRYHTVFQRTALIILAAMAASAQAQQPATPQRTQPAPAAPVIPAAPAVPAASVSPGPAAPAVPAGPAAPAGPTAVPQQQEEMVPRLEFPNSDVKEVLSFYGRLTGKRIVYDNTVQGPVNIAILTPLKKSEAIHIIETNLLLNGFSLVPGDGEIVKVIGLTKNPRIAGVPIISDEAEIPDTDKVVTFLVKLEYADPTELQQTLSQYIAPSLYTSVVALPKSQAMLITESSPVLRGLLRVIREIDIAPAPVVSEFIKLERADVKSVLDKLEKMFEKQPNQTGSAAAAAPVPQRPRGPGAPPTPNTGESAGFTAEGGYTLTEDSIIVGKIKLTADERTNRIHVVTREVNLPFIRKLIHEFDSDVKFGEPSARVLRYVAAGDVLDIVVKAITEKGDENAANAASQTNTNQNRQNNNQNAGTNLLGSSSSSSSSSGGGLSVSEGLATQDRDTTPTAVTIGNTKIIADRRTNAIIVLGNNDVKKKIFDVLDQLDVRAPQVMLNTVIGEFNLGNNRHLGVHYFVGNNDVNPIINTTGTTGGGTTIVSGTNGTRSGVGITSAGVPFLDFSNILSARNLSNITPFFTGGATGLQGFLAAGDSLGALVDALQTTGRFKVTQRPMVFTTNNKKAVIASGEEIAVPVSTLSNVDTTSTVTGVAAVQSSVQFKQVTLQLEVVPLINSDREVALDILQKLDSLTGEVTQVGGNNIPTISTRYIRTSVSVPNKATVALGGLIKEENQKNDSGVPYLSKIPLLGALFRDTSRVHNRSELIILMCPQVVNTPQEIVDNTQREQQRLSIEPDLEATLDATAGDRAIKPRIEKAIPVNSDR
jgi:general secretion pathway protein D